MQTTGSSLPSFERRPGAPILDQGGLLRIEHPPPAGVLRDDRPHERQGVSERNARLLERGRDDQHQPARYRPRTGHRCRSQ